MFVVLGHVGSDAGYWYIGADGKVHHAPGWGIDAMREVSVALSIIQQAAQLKTPGLADTVVHGLASFATKQIEENVNKSAQIVIIGGPQAGAQAVGR